MKNNYVLGLVLVGVMGLSSCTQSKNDPPTNVGAKALTIEGQVIQNLSHNVIVSTYKGLSDSTAALREQVTILSQARTQENLEKAQDLWKQSRFYWESTEAFLFGPVELLSIDPMIDTWPLNRADLQSILDQGAPITADVIRSSGTNLKGFHTVEYLLFGNGLQTNKKSIAALTAREVEYLKATTVVLAEDTAKLTAAWTKNYNPDDASSTPYVDVISTPGSSSSLYASNEAVLIELLNGMVGIADEVANTKIAEPLGADIQSADLDKEESPYSWNSVSDFSNNIRSIRMMFWGSTGSTISGMGFKTLLDKKDPELSNKVAAQIDLAIQKIQDIAGPEGTPFGKAIKDSEKRQRVLVAQAEVLNLFSLLEQKVLPLFQ